MSRKRVPSRLEKALLYLMHTWVEIYSSQGLLKRPLPIALNSVRELIYSKRYDPGLNAQSRCPLFRNQEA